MKRNGVGAAFLLKKKWTRRLVYSSSPALSSSFSFLYHSSASYSSYVNRRDHYRAFTSADEAKLNEIITTKPLQLIEHVRETMKLSSRRIVHFRNSVTYIAIIVQSRLSSKSMSPDVAATIVEHLMKECAALKQADMAHLLFRAALRFDRFGVSLHSSFVKLLYQSHRDNINLDRVLRSVGDELKHAGNVHCAAIAYLLSGQSVSMKDFPLADAKPKDILILIECYGSKGKYEEGLQLLKKLVTEKVFQGHSNVTNDIFSASLCSVGGSPETINAIIALGRENGIQFSEKAGAVALSLRLASLNSFKEISIEEQRMIEELRIHDDTRLMMSSAVISRCVELALRQANVEDQEYLLKKVKCVSDFFEHKSSKSSYEDKDTLAAVSVIRGYGCLGNYSKLTSLFHVLRDLPLPNSHRIYEETLRWYSYSSNVKEAVALKEEMSSKHVYHTIHAYQYLFRCFDTYYPHLTQKYFREMRSKGIRLDGYITPLLIRAFGAMKDWSRVEALYSEAKSGAVKCGTKSFSSRIVIQMLKSYQGNLERCREIIADAEKFGLLTDGGVQTECVLALSSSKEKNEIEKLITRFPSKTPQLYRALLKISTRRKNREDLDYLMKEIESSVVWDERLAVSVISAYSHFNDVDAVHRYVELAKEKKIIESPLFFADAAIAFGRLGEQKAIDRCWNWMLASNLNITMPAFNRFLELYMKRNNITKVQEVLDTIMRMVSPNPSTATSVMNMLGKMGRLTEMEAVLDSMYTSTNALPTLATLHTAMSAFAKVGNVEKMEWIREKIRQDGFAENALTYNILFEGYGKAKRFGRIHELIKEREQAGVDMDDSGYVVLLAIFTREKLAEDIEELVKNIVSGGSSLNNKILAYIAAGYASINNTVEMDKYISMLLEHPECSPRDLEMVCLMYSKFRDTMKLQAMLGNPKLKKSEKMYNLCVSAFAKAGDYTKVGSLLEEMDKEKYTLSRSTSILLSSLLVKAGKPELAQAVLKWKSEKEDDLEEAEELEELGKEENEYEDREEENEEEIQL